MGVDLIDRWNKVLDVIKKVAKPPGIPLPAAAAFSLEMGAAPAKAASGVGSPTPAAEA